MKAICSILIANRGEIAVRVMRTCREMKIRSIAVYSKPDRHALHVRYADEAYCIGEASPKESYLNMARIIEVAQKSEADAIHPGYGFLSENADFARLVERAGLVLIGPKAHSMEAMGSKTRARQVMQQADVPVVPGLIDPVKNIEEARMHAERITFPLMLKAAAGGGGKGMRKVDSLADFDSAFEAVRGEAQNAFGDDAIYLEKFLEKPRHIEVQIFADTHGKVVSFPERECSVQRRHQKLIEESPSPFVTPSMRAAMGKIARQAARAVDYVGAGTVEFLVDAQRNFYFMEMNTRLQVEHPITELITGTDLVALQIKVAQGEKLPFETEQVEGTGHAMEARICAEDPDNNFLPTPGPIHHFTPPSGPYVRTDAGIEAGSVISMNYDSMIAKVIAYADSRELSRRRLQRALQELVIDGCTHNAHFLHGLLDDVAFCAGEYDTGLIDGHLARRHQREISEEELIAAALFHLHQQPKKAQPAGQHKQSAWQQSASPFVGI